MSASSSTSATNKRRNSVREDNEKTNQTSKRQATEASPVPVSASVPPPLVALPPPLMQYPNGQFVSVVHHPHQQPYYHMYHPQQPIYYPISPQQHPFLSPTMPPTQEVSNTGAKKSTTPRILPKNPESPGMYPQQQQQQSPMSPPFYHPYSLQMSPTLMPSPYVSSSGRHDSISSSPGLGPSNAINTTNTATTADQREKARKVSHSAIERRRRERINDKILQLKQLIPSCVEQDNLHKMSILQSAIDYISYLKEIVKKLDEKSGGDELLKGDHLKVKMQKSMLPKEVEPFTNQFSVHQTSTKTQQQQETDKEQRRSDLVIVEHQKGLKPMDIIKSGTPIISTGTTPLTPPQEPQQDSTTATTATNFEPTINRVSASATTATTTTTTTTSDETKHMSLQNILC